MTANCPLCNKPSALSFQAKDYNRRITDQTFNYFQCPSCSLIFLSPIPSDLGKFYADAYHKVPSSRAELQRRAKPEQYKIELIKRFVTHGHLLEIGPSHGSFAYCAKESGFSVDVIEMDEQCCQYISTELGIPAVQSNEPARSLDTMGPYDVIALWHVIEHLPSPWQVIDTAIQRLNPDGILVLAAPNPSSLQFRFMKRFWPHVDAPRHVMLIPLDLLKTHLESEKMTTVLATTSDQGGLGWNTFGWQYALSNLTANRYLKFALHHIGAAVTWMFMPWERKELNGTAYTLIAKKGGKP